MKAPAYWKAESAYGSCNGPARHDSLLVVVVVVDDVDDEVSVEAAIPHVVSVHPKLVVTLKVANVQPPYP